MRTQIMRPVPSVFVKSLDPMEDMSDFLRGYLLRPFIRNVDATAEMKLDVVDNDEEYVVVAEIPGAKKDDIHVSIEGNHVTITAEVRKEVEAKSDETLVHSERYYGTQSRMLTLAAEIDETKAEAKYENGLLTLTLPKKSGAMSKELTIK